jgi:hypothetical protein
MATSIDFCKTAGSILIAATILFCCKKNSSDNGGNGNGGNGNGNNTGVSSADSISNHFQFDHAKKITGAAPKGPKSSSIKISFKDTLFLVDQVRLPIRFFQPDTSQHITGVFIQVMGLQGGPVATTYYDVPGVPQVDTTSDTVAVVMVGIDPTGIKLPTGFNITITPHNSSGDPVAQVVRPVVILPRHNNPKPGSGSCGIVLPASKVWEWQSSYVLDVGTGNNYFFYDDPFTVLGKGGQQIGGSCCAGTPLYGICPGSRQPNVFLHFKTYVQILEERFIYDDLGGYFRLTSEDAPIPQPDISNWCSNGPGAVKPNIANVSYAGTYQITPASIPADLQTLHDSLQLSYQTVGVNPPGGGFGNGGGIIHLIDCEHGMLELIQPDLEGFGHHLYRFYKAMFPQDVKWFTMDS